LNFKLRDADTVFGEKDSDPGITSVNESVVHIYKSVTLENGAIIRATNKYYGKPWFSNISVRMNSNELFNYTSNEGICYGQVIV